MNNKRFSEELKNATKYHHQFSEKNIFVQKLFKGVLPIQAYLYYLENILPIYQNVERYLKNNHQLKLLASFHIPALFRENHLINDILSLRLRLNQHIHSEINNQKVLFRITSPEQCIGVFYTRYLGDLSGGQIISNNLVKKYHFNSSELNFYKFNTQPPTNTQALVKLIKDKLDDLKIDHKQQICIISEAKKMFDFTGNAMNKAIQEHINNG